MYRLHTARNRFCRRRLGTLVCGVVFARQTKSVLPFGLFTRLAAWIGFLSLCLTTQGCGGPAIRSSTSLRSCQRCPSKKNHTNPSGSAMGKSRSATVVCAYLMKQNDWTPKQALGNLRQARPFCEPNDGFMRQLQVFYDSRMSDDLENSTAYQRWMYQRELDMSRACRQAPDSDKIRFEDEHRPDEAVDLSLRCRRCRYVSVTAYQTRR